MHSIQEIDLRGKKILEIGTGNGGTTLEILELMHKYPNSTLITTDITDIYTNFSEFMKDYPTLISRVQFIQSDATILEGIEKNSIDIIICNYTLCAINSHSGKAVIALKKFFDTLKSGGILLIEEEYPIFSPENQYQKLWANKWKIIKIALISSLNRAYNEIDPQILNEMLKMIGFREIEIEKGFNIQHKTELIPLFHSQLSNIIQNIKNNNLKKEISKMSKKLIKEIEYYESIEIPNFLIFAVK